MFRDTEERCFYKVIKVHLAALPLLLQYNTKSAISIHHLHCSSILIIYCCNPMSETVEGKKNTLDKINAVPLSSVLYGDNDIFC
jgi:hypothetical protein